MDLKLLGNRIKELRITQHLSQDKLGELTGLNGKYLGEVERGNANISINNLSKISIALNIPLTNLIDINHEQNKEILSYFKDYCTKHQSTFYPLQVEKQYQYPYHLHFHQKECA